MARVVLFGAIIVLSVADDNNQVMGFHQGTLTNLVFGDVNLCCGIEQSLVYIIMYFLL